MYIPQAFHISDSKKLLPFIEANPFGQLTSTVEGRLFSSHLPFALANAGRCLTCHVARPNPQWWEIEAQEVLVTFQGPHAYVSPSWYGSPGGSASVPTWNYQAVHIYGRAEVISDEARLERMVKQSAEKYESMLAKPWQPEFDRTLLSHIVGLEIRITEIQGKDKLSQNRSASDREGVMEALRISGMDALVKAMEDVL